MKRTRKIIFIGILCAFCLAGCGRTEKQAEDSGELVLVSARTVLKGGADAQGIYRAKCDHQR